MAPPKPVPVKRPMFRRYSGERSWTEWIRDYHPDIATSVCMFVLVAAVIPAIQPVLARTFVMGHNVTTDAPAASDGETFYTFGRNDILNVAYYVLAWISFHAILEEAYLDSLARRLHLSRTKTGELHESGEVVIFHLITLVWGADLIAKGGQLAQSSLMWTDYPQPNMTFGTKFFFILQIAHWMHSAAEVFLMRARKEDVPRLVGEALGYVAFILFAYLGSFHRAGVVLIVVHSLAEFLFHVSRMADYSGRTTFAANAYKIWGVVWIIARHVTIHTTLRLWSGLAGESEEWKPRAGSINTPLVRHLLLASVIALQLFLGFRQCRKHLAEPSLLSDLLLPKNARAAAGPRTKSKRATGASADEGEKSD